MVLFFAFSNFQALFFLIFPQILVHIFHHVHNFRPFLFHHFQIFEYLIIYYYCASDLFYFGLFCFVILYFYVQFFSTFFKFWKFLVVTIFFALRVLVVIFCQIFFSYALPLRYVFNLAVQFASIPGGALVEADLALKIARTRSR